MSSPSPPPFDDGLDDALLALPDALPLPVPPKRALLSVTNLADTRHCELQALYVCTLRGGRRRRTQAMRDGEAAHAALEREANGPALEIEVVSREDSFAVVVLNAIGLLEALAAGILDRVREIPVWGRIAGQLVWGYLDQLERRQGVDGLVISDTKTVAGIPRDPDRKAAGPGGLQISVYKHLFDRLVTGGDERFSDAKELLAALGLDAEANLSTAIVGRISAMGLIVQQDRPVTPDPPLPSTFATNPDGTIVIGSDAEPEPSSSQSTPNRPQTSAPETLSALLPHLLLRFSLLPTSTDRPELCLVPRDPGKTGHTVAVPFSPAEFDAAARRAVEVWTGAREPCGPDVEEAWKCAECEFAEGCGFRIRRAEEMAARGMRKAWTA
ncbi:exonuclease V [Hyaloraphidium curvatum]|nr:exonuclease V [Hyaloraphidium curvatum]